MQERACVVFQSYFETVTEVNYTCCRYHPAHALFDYCGHASQYVQHTIHAVTVVAGGIFNVML